MIKEEKIGKRIFVEQTTYYIYLNNKERKDDYAFIITSDKKLFDAYKKQIKDRLK
jgi:hypothetical protein